MPPIQLTDTTVLPEDDEPGAQQAFDRLVDEGVKRIVVVLGNTPSAESVVDRMDNLIARANRIPPRDWHCLWVRRSSHLDRKFARLGGAPTLQRQLADSIAFSIKPGGVVCDVIPRAHGTPDNVRLMELLARTERD